jgi:hypothetical protein
MFEYKMGPTKPTEAILGQLQPTMNKQPERPRRGSLPDLKTLDKGEKKVPTGPRANPLYKTRLCMNFQSTGSCPYTEKCQFAHGVDELEKWEAWRNSQPKDEVSKENQTPGNRSRSSSVERPQGNSLEGSEFGSPLSAPMTPYDLSTPVLSSVNSVLDDSPISTLQSEFSLWSANLDSVDKPFRPELRGRAATFDCTYDNISQLSDAPTLFSSPPVIVNNLGRLSLQ